ncbi:MAG: hypothetical protein D6830_03030 [Ignavibacteria bacterium]|nr:MAG: hypothetical protein D6830_03030 [Ignavibacteria bacterium]
MKVAVATGNYKNIVGHVGRCKGFIIFDIENGQILSKKEIENPLKHDEHHSHHSHEGHNHMHHHGHHRHEFLAGALEGAEALLCKSAGWGMISSLNDRGIKVLFTEESVAEKGAIEYSNGKLDYTDPNDDYSE